MVEVPSAVRLLLAIAITVGVTLLAVKLLRKQIMGISTRDELANLDRIEAGDVTHKSEEREHLPAPPSWDLSQRVIGMTTSAFVFLLAFTLSSYWSTARDARTATISEATYWAQAMATAQRLPADEGGPAVVESLVQYRDSVVGEQWRDMQGASTEVVQQQQIAINSAVAKSLLAADKEGASNAPVWPQLTDAVDNMYEQATARLNALPNKSAPGVLTIIFLLGMTNLALVVVFQPSRFGTNMFLAGTLAAITAFLLFVVVETSNPFTGGASVSRPLIMTQNLER